MTQTENGAVRTREVQILNLACILHGGTLEQCKETATRYILEAEARGAEEQRRKDAEEQKVSWLRFIGGRIEETTDRSEALKWANGSKIITTWRPANVAALEDRIAEQEAAEQLALADAKASKAREEKLKRVTLDILQVCQRSKMGPSDLGYVTRMICATLTRESEKSGPIDYLSEPGPGEGSALTRGGGV